MLVAGRGEKVNLDPLEDPQNLADGHGRSKFLGDSKAGKKAIKAQLSPIYLGE